MAELTVEFFGGPLDGTTGTVGSTRAGRPPDLYAIDASAQGSRTRCRHDYRIGADPPAGHRWRYEYRGIRPG
jgi:hypothetical protein